jgi:amidase
MNRRELLKLSLMGGVAALGNAGAVGDGGASGRWTNLSLRELEAALVSGEVSSVALCEFYLARIEAMNVRGPELRAILETNPEALAIAAALDQERRVKGARGPLHGIPLVLKDNLDTGDAMETTAGSLALLGSRAPRDAFVVKRLRDAGAIVLAKANLSEWANLRSTRPTSGWSARGGQARNPFALDRSPIGSSSGSGAAVAADLCAAAIGTETDGSITAPCSAMGLVGVKPTVGLLSRAGIIPLSPSQDSPGPMTRTVEDAALLLNAMAGEDPDDAATTPRGRRPALDYTRALAKDALKGARLGVARNLFGGGPGVGQVMATALRELEGLGATLVDVELKASELAEPELEVLLHELKASLGEYLAARRPGAKVRSLADVIAFNLRHAAEELVWFGQELFERAQAKGPLTAPPYQKALAACRRQARKEGLDGQARAHRLDAFVSSTLEPAWLIDPLLGDPPAAFGGSMPAVAGYPSVTVPAGDVAGLPVGLLFFGAPWSEPTLLGYAYAYEQASRQRRVPTFARTLTPSE